MKFDFYIGFYVFVIFSFLGWVSEVVYKWFDSKKLINRGFLFGPVCPIYGFSILLIFLFLLRFKKYHLILFIGSSILISSLELLTGIILERLFKQKWWTYSSYRFNFKGYICLRFSILWGLGAVLVVNFILPIVLNLIEMIPFPVGKVLIYVLLIAMLLDFCFTLISIGKIRKYIAIITKNGFSNLKVKQSNAFAKIIPKIKHFMNAFPKLKLLSKLKKNKKNNNGEDKEL